MNKIVQSVYKRAVLILVGASCFGPIFKAEAGVFSLSRFVLPGNFAVGLEPEFTFSQGTGMGFNLKYTQGLNDLSNLGLGIGTGPDGRGFRIGGDYVFDFFPDVEGQPGIGIAGRTYFYQVYKTRSQVEATLVPYVHKAFQSKNTEFEPFVAIPFGIALGDGTKTLATFSVGAIIKANEHLRYVTELGVAISNSSSYFSGGLIYYQ